MHEPTANRQTHWNFGNPRGNPVSLEEFLAQQEVAGFSFTGVKLSPEQYLNHLVKQHVCENCQEEGHEEITTPEVKIT
jgi:hypothetical protein